VLSGSVVGSCRCLHCCAWLQGPDGQVVYQFEPACQLGAKLAGVHWWFKSRGHAAELTAGYYNTRDRDGYEPVFKVGARQAAASASYACSLQQQHWLVPAIICIHDSGKRWTPGCCKTPCTAGLVACFGGCERMLCPAAGAVLAPRTPELHVCGDARLRAPAGGQVLTRGAAGTGGQPALLPAAGVCNTDAVLLRPACTMRIYACRCHEPQPGVHLIPSVHPHPPAAWALTHLPSHTPHTQVIECSERWGVPLAGENALQRYDGYAFDRIAESAFGRNARAGRLEKLTFLRMGDLMFDNWDAFSSFLERMRRCDQ
jgi:hypothetical protein